VDRIFIPASDLCNEFDTGREKLSSYNIGKDVTTTTTTISDDGDRISSSTTTTANTIPLVLLHLTITSQEHLLGNIREYLRVTLTFPLPPQWRIQYELDDIPEYYHNDPIQEALVSSMETQLSNARRVKENKGRIVEDSVRRRKKGTVGVLGKLGRNVMRERREDRLKELKKLNQQKEIRIIDGSDDDGAMDSNILDVKRRTSLTSAVALLRRQRYRKYSVGERRKEAMTRGKVENPFMALAEAQFDDRPEDEYVTKEDEDDLAKFR